MFTLEFFQSYWWFLISVLGAVLVFLLFIQGGQTLLIETRREIDRTLMVNALGRKWELSFTTLVVFGGAFFASFPLFYSTSFGGAYWLWILILLGFILQAVSYEFRSKCGNIFGKRTYDVFLAINGILACLLLGVAVSTFFLGAEFSIQKQNLLDGSSPMISSWVSTHGLEAIWSFNIVLGIAILFLARTQASLFFIKTINSGEVLSERLRLNVLRDGTIFVLFFLIFLAMLLAAHGYQVNIDGKIEIVELKYLNNFMDMWWVAAIFLVGVAMVLYAIYRTSFAFQYDNGIWFSGIGSMLVVMSLFWIAGYNNTAYYPSLIDAQDSLTIANSSSSEYTLRAMSIVSLLVPFVAAYIIYAWRALTRKIITPEEMNSTSHKY